MINIINKILIANVLMSYLGLFFNVFFNVGDGIILEFIGDKQF